MSLESGYWLYDKNSFFQIEHITLWMLHKNFGHFDHYWSLMDHWIYDSMGSPPLLCRFYRLVTDNLNLALCPSLNLTMSKMSNWIQLKFGQFLTMWGASIWHRDNVYAIKNNLNERIWRNGQILKFLNPWTFPATESSIMVLPK